MAHSMEQLGQLRPANTTAASLYSPSSGETLIKSIVACNVGTVAAKFRVFHDDNGTTYDETSALYWDVEVPAGHSANIEVNIMMNDATGNLAVRTDTNSAFNFTCYGSEVT